ncbi:MAG: PilZ domain-containing protein [Anaerolineales bacterium]|nr:MAG: PilZ domain-containing protein [Anaerolineales bacterium]
MESDRRKQQRRRFTYYMPVVDAGTLKVLGYLSDISLVGFRVDSDMPLPVNSHLRLRIDLAPELAAKTYMIFNGRIRWCEMDKLQPNSYNIGFEVESLSREDTAIFQRMFEQCGMDIR